MNPKRKTIDVKTLLDSANFQLKRTDKFASKDYKRAISDMIEDVLMKTGNYSGFGFEDNNDCKYDSDGYYNRFYYVLLYYIRLYYFRLNEFK